jgi:hypothetical protein
MFAMNEFHAADVHRALSTLLRELIDGAHEETAWVLNPGDQGLLTSLERLSAADASAPAPGGGPPIAAHVDHLRYGLELLNRWSRGEEPFAEANYSASWGRTSVTDTEWADLRDQLRREAALTGMLASVTHLAYHLGAIRQVNRALRGPQARD